MNRLFLCALLLSGCVAQALVLPPQDMRPAAVQFGLRFAHADRAVPLQGAVQMSEQEGSLGLIFPHGPTLGVCRYRTGGMECSLAGEGSAGTRFMLQRIGLAVYRILPALMREPVRDITEADWTLRWKETDAGRRAEYRDLEAQVTLEMLFTEIARP